jgi:hypothetical protein
MTQPCVWSLPGRCTHHRPHGSLRTHGKVTGMAEAIGRGSFIPMDPVNHPEVGTLTASRRHAGSGARRRVEHSMAILFSQGKEKVVPSTLKTLGVFFAAFLFASASISDAFAREYKRSGSYKTGKGKTGTIQSEGSRGGGKVTRNQSVTTEDGKTLTREVNRTYDKETGSFERSVTNPKGETRTATGTVGADGTRTGTLTTGKGKTGNFSGNTVRNEDGSVTRTGSVTMDSGKTLNRTATAKYDKETGTANRTVTDPDGSTRENSATIQGNASQ